jgi:hypothetical protein
MPKAAAALSRDPRLEVGRVEMVGGVAAQAADGDPEVPRVRRVLALPERNAASLLPSCGAATAAAFTALLYSPSGAAIVLCDGTLQ